MPDLDALLKNNREWARRMVEQDPLFFRRLAELQTPEYLWIGCSDSRVPANQITGLLPGEVFVHRNVANLVVRSDLNCLAVVQYAVDVLHVKHIIVCGHYGCGGVRAALGDRRLGLIDNWLGHIASVRDRHAGVLEGLPDVQRWRRLCELNVVEQARHLCLSSVVQDVWARGQTVAVHAWIYGVEDGLIRDLAPGVKAADDVADICDAAIARIAADEGPRPASARATDSAF
ncbi:MAG: carbonate dehydratase [Rhodospirillaceae bacterium]|nr:carbonate dehydratase [Rhodospirillaceae bacterium]